MATEKYDGAKNKFNVSEATVKEDSKRLNMTESEYRALLNSFIDTYSKNPLFAYQHTDLSDVPVTFEVPDRRGMTGSYSPNSKQITMYPSRDLDSMMKTLIHELNHAASDKAGNLDSERMNVVGSSPQAVAAKSDPVNKALSYGTAELAAWLTQATHPAFGGKETATRSVDDIVNSFFNRHKEVLTNFASRTAQPNRPVTRHPKSEIELSTTERLLDHLFNFSGKARPYAVDLSYHQEEKDLVAPGRRYRTETTSESTDDKNKATPLKFK